MRSSFQNRIHCCNQIDPWCQQKTWKVMKLWKDWHVPISTSNGHPQPKIIKAIGGVRGQKMMFGYFGRSHWAWIAAFYRMSKFNFVQKLLQFQFRKFGRISHKFPDKNEILEYITQKDSRLTIFVQNGWNFHQMTTTCRETKLRSMFGKFWILAVLYSFESKNGPKNEKNRQNLAFFGPLLC